MQSQEKRNPVDKVHTGQSVEYYERCRRRRGVGPGCGGQKSEDRKASTDLWVIE